MADRDGSNAPAGTAAGMVIPLSDQKAPPPSVSLMEGAFPLAQSLSRQLHFAAGGIYPGSGEPVHGVPDRGTVVIPQIFIHLDGNGNS